MARGRKAESGTIEAREYINSGRLDGFISRIEDLSSEAKTRIIKAYKFGLGIKEVQADQGIVTESIPVIKENKKAIKEAKKSLEIGDVYFPKEDCKEVEY